MGESRQRAGEGCRVGVHQCGIRVPVASLVALWNSAHHIDDAAGDFEIDAIAHAQGLITALPCLPATHLCQRFNVRVHILHARTRTNARHESLHDLLLVIAFHDACSPRRTHTLPHRSII